MKILFVVAVIFLASFVACDCDQLDGTNWSCSGGSGKYPIQNFAFDDDEFQLYLRYEDCTVFQDGNFEVDGNTINIDFGVLDNCEAADENNDNCECFDDFEMQINDQCLIITGPNGENCVPQGDCAKQSCSNGDTPISDPDYEPSTNECGPASIPFGAPSFAFGECCNNHDRCYPVCNKEKRDCDYEFYSCMACACYEEYDTDVGEELCLILACLYFQAVDEFGCDAYESSQDNGCICPNNAKGIEAPRKYRDVHDKFGGLHTVDEALELYAKGTLGLSDFICDAPLNPDCPNTSVSPASPVSSNNNSPASPVSTNNSPASTNNSPASNSNSSGSSNDSAGSMLVAGALTVIAAALI